MVRNGDPLSNSAYSHEADVSYEDRVVAFIDILGWGQAVEDSVRSPESRRRLLNVVWALGALSKNDTEEETSENPSFDAATQFSDSVVISIPYSGHLDVMRLVRQITSYQHTTLMSGFPLRGGIAVGPLYHSGSLVFGPALNEAHQLESKCALYPRVIIAKSLESQIEKAKASFPPHWPFVVKDEDGFYSTDDLMTFAMSDWSTAHFDQKIEDWLSAHRTDERVFAKYSWLKQRWQATKADAAWRVEKSRRLRADFIR